MNIIFYCHRLLILSQDQILQEVVASAFAEKTVLTIAVSIALIDMLTCLGAAEYLCNKVFKEETHTRILKNLKEREKYSLQNSAKMMKIG